MARSSTVRVKGYRDFQRAIARADKDTKREVRNAFREVGDIVRVDAENRLDDTSPKSAAGLRTRVRQRGVAVEQSLRRTTGKRPDWGKHQMREALVPALEDNTQQVMREFEEALDRVADRFDN